LQAPDSGLCGVGKIMTSIFLMKQIVGSTTQFIL